MSKKQKLNLITASLNFTFDKSKIVKALKKTFGKTSPGSDIRHKDVWYNPSTCSVIFILYFCYLRDVMNEISQSIFVLTLSPGNNVILSAMIICDNLFFK